LIAIEPAYFNVQGSSGPGGVRRITIIMGGTDPTTAP
jgi:hypothetical protein